MAAYKVIQDVEAEDKILGPLTLRQFIYGGIAAISLYLTYFVSTHRAGFLAIILIPVALITGFFAFPWGRDQPTEVWALAKIRFMLKPRRRIWNQSGVKELVTVTAPKKTESAYANHLSETEVKSRLRALADTLDSRGWAIKNANVNLYAPPPLVMAEPNSQRLIGIEDLPQQVAAVDIRPTDDMLDERNNPLAKQMTSKIEASARAQRQRIMERFKQPAAAPVPKAPPSTPPNNYWFLNQPSQSAQVPNDMVTFNTQVITPGGDDPAAQITPPAQPTAVAADTPVDLPIDEASVLKTLEEKKREMPMSSYYGHLHTIQPLSVQQQQAKAQQQAQAAAAASAAAQQPAPPPPPPPVTPERQAAILQLANNDDLNVATIAREAANRSGSLDGEVVIKLH